MTDAKTIAARFREAYDPEHQRSLWRQLNYAFGEGWSETTQEIKRGATFDFPPIQIKKLRIGQTRRLMVSQFVDVTRNMYSSPSAEFPGVDRYTAKMRAEFLAKRATNAWDKACQQTFIEGNGVGQSFLRIGLVAGAGGTQRVEVEHASALKVFYDPHARSFEDARYVFVEVSVPWDEAVRLYPSLGDAQKVQDSFRDPLRKRESAKIYEYHDLDGEGGTRAIFVHDVDEVSPKPVEHGENPFHPELPVAAYEHLLVPLLDRPVGRIPLLMATQEAENELLSYIRRTLTRTGYDAIRGNHDPDQVERVMSGEQDYLLVESGIEGAPIQRVPAAEVPQTALLLLQRLQQQFDEESGTSTYDRGSMPTGERTKYEVQAFMSRQGGQGSWSSRQTARMYGRLFEKVALIAARFDREPVTVDVFGHDVVLNAAEDPRTHLDQVFADESPIVVSERSLTYMDQQARRGERVAEIGQIGQMLLPLGAIAPQTFARRLLEAAGETDVEEWLAQPQQLAPEGTPAPAGAQAPSTQPAPVPTGAPTPIAA